MDLLRRIRLRWPVYLKHEGPLALQPGQKLLMVMEVPAGSNTRLEFGATWVEIPYTPTNSVTIPSEVTA